MADQFTPVPVKGLKTNNSAAPSTDQVPVLGALANAATPSYTEGNEVKQSVDLNGSTRTLLLDSTGTPYGTVTNPLVVDTTAVDLTYFYAADSTVALAAGGSDTIDGAPITDTVVGNLSQVTVSSSVRFKAVVETYDGTTATTVAVLFGKENDVVTWSPANGTYINETGNAGSTALFRVTVTNMDNLFAADIYATIEHSE